MTIERLSTVLPPPGDDRRPSTTDWTAVEAALGTSLPGDYRAFVERYGVGRIAGFLWVFVPGASHDTVDLLAQVAVQREVLCELAASGETIPFASYPEPGGLLAVGMTDNGNVLHWNTTGLTDDWTIVVQEARGPFFTSTDQDLTGFLAGVLDRTVRCPAFPDDFPNDAIAFEAQ